MVDSHKDQGVGRRRSPRDEEDDDRAYSHEEGNQNEPTVVNVPEERTSLDHRIRFSQDVDRQELARRKRRKSDELEREVAENASAHSTPHKLFANTGQSQVPTGRNRGLSMRSALFQRNMSQTRTGDIELQDVDSSSEPQDAGARPPKASKVSDSVTVNPVEDSWPSDSPLNKEAKTRGQGISSLPNYRQWASNHARKHLPLKRMKAAYEQAYKFVLRIQEIPPTKDGRHIPLDPSRKEPLIDERIQDHFISNMIRSSKYSAWNFIPFQLFAQFRRIANLYFLCVSILQMIPGLSTTGTYTTIVPLLFFVSLSMAKEGYEDLRRHRLDKTENNREAEVLHVYKPVASDTADEQFKGSDASISVNGSVHWAPRKWQSLQVGDIVKLMRDDAVPADLVLLSSQGANNTAYVETMALDGETNLKAKQPSPATVEAALDIYKEGPWGLVVAEDPNVDLYSFEGRVTVDGKTSPLTNNEIIYRGSVIRNTPECIGMVIYTGEECKIRMNANKNPRIKAPALQAVVNKIVIGMVFFVLFLAIFNSVAYQLWQDTTEQKSWYISEAPVGFGPLLTSFIIMFNTLIPLSLYVSLEIIKVSQMALMNMDVDMYDAESNTPFEARTSTINEELGQVGYIFSDKTGTITQNVMKFRCLSLGGKAFLHDTDLQPSQPEMLPRKSKGKKTTRNSRKSASREFSSHDFASSNANGSNIESASRSSSRPPRPSRASTSQWRSSAMPGMPQDEQLRTQDLLRYLQRWPHTVFAQRAKMMLLSIAVCHTCLPERSADSEDGITFQASSPDELALVRAAQELGYLAYERDAATLTIRVYANGQDAEPLLEKYEVLDVIEFSSQRKRMSTVVRMPNGKICVLCKGADSVIIKKLRLAGLATQKLVEIHEQSLRRKSMDAQEALRRKSSIGSGSLISMPRTSNPLARRSMTRSRSSVGRLEPIRDDLDNWLNLREHDFANSPRTSSQYRRQMPSRRVSMQVESDMIDDGAASDESLVIERCLQHVNEFATEGLRTLMYGYRYLSEEEYTGWKNIFHDAATSLTNRTELIEKAGDMIEQQLELGGATAIEDKLQDGVPETIDRLRRANIKMWMLTGDKRETAINIGHSCRLIKDYSSVTVLDSEVGEVERNIATAIVDINRGGVAHSVVVIDGQTLAHLQADETLLALFLDLAILTDSVVCCRASPSQKALLVHEVRMRLKKGVTLAIGDGANDIAMIQEAHVGIGITGKEGLQAARTSDYSIAQFRFLTKLLLVHGRWNYIRTCKYTVGTFYKEMLFYLTQALYQRHNGYSGTSLYESWSLSMFNTLFTSLTIIFLGIFEQDLRASTLIAVPELYTKGQRAGGFNIKVFVGWIFTAVASAMIIYFTTWGLYGDAIFSNENTVFALGNMSFTACIVVISIKLQLIEQRYKSVMAALAIICSVGGWFLWNLILAATYAPGLKYAVRGGIFSRFGPSALWWLALIISIVACCLFEIGIQAITGTFCPTDVEVFQTLEGESDVRERFEEASVMWLRQGWEYRDGKRKYLEEGQNMAAEEQEKREGEVEKLLLSRPSTLEEARGVGVGQPRRVQTEEELVMISDGPRNSVQIDEMLSKRFGNVRREQMTPSN